MILSGCITPQSECYAVGWIIPMREIPVEIRVVYDALLFQKEIPEKVRSYYKKWLRCYLDFCQKYDPEKSDKGSISHFISKLKQKKQYAICLRKKLQETLPRK